MTDWPKLLEGNCRPHLQLVWKVKQVQPQKNFRQPPSQGQQGITTIKTNTVFSLKDISFRGGAPAKKKWVVQTTIPQPIHTVNHMLVKAVGMRFTLALKAWTLEGGRKANPLSQHPWVLQIIKGFQIQIPFVGEKEAKSAFLSLRTVSLDRRGPSLLEKEAVTDLVCTKWLLP